jgi:tetratricopeptide (TPR) repeat protein
VRSARWRRVWPSSRTTRSSRRTCNGSSRATCAAGGRGPALAFPAWRLALLTADARAAPLRTPRAQAAALGVFTFLVYALGACRTIYVGDSGELVTAVYVLGIPHPSGYPLYVLLGKLWTLLVPLGSIAFRMSLFSAAMGALAVAIAHWTLRRLGVGAWAAGTAALIIAFAPSFWGEANVQRVYTLNAVFVALATAVMFDWQRTRDDRRIVLAALVCGLGATNHTFMVIFAAAIGAFVLITDWRVLKRWRTIARAAGAFAAGLLVYLYLPIRSRYDPPLDWSNPETPSALWRVISRRDFWERRFIEGPRDLIPIGWDYVRSLGPELAWVGTVLAVVGVVVGFRRRWPVLLPLLAMVANLLAVALHGSRSDIFIWHRYYIPSYLMGALLAGLGAHVLLERLPARARPLLLAVPLAALVLRFPEFDRSRYRIADEFSKTLLANLPPGAHLTASDDNILFVLMYLRFVEGLRPDVDLILEGVADAQPPALRFNPDVDPLFLTHHPNWSVKGLEVIPVGLVFQTVREGRNTPPPKMFKEKLEGEDDPRVPKDYLTQNLIGHYHYMLGSTWELWDWPRAKREYEKAQQASPGNDVLFFNLGLIYRRAGLLEESLRAFERSNEINPRHIASRDRVQASQRAADVRAELEQLRAVERELEPQLEAGVTKGSAEWHRQMSALLRDRGLVVPAKGHALRAEEP